MKNVREKPSERERKILEALIEDDMRFNELLRKTHITSATLSEDLKKLTNENRVFRRYSSTKNGTVICLTPREKFKRYHVMELSKFIGLKIRMYMIENNLKSINDVDLKKVFETESPDKIIEGFDLIEISDTEKREALGEVWSEWISIIYKDKW